MKRLLLFVVSLVLAPGCQGQTLQVGGDAAGAGSSASSPNQPASSPGSSPVWTGYFQNFKFADGADSVTMNLVFSGGTVTGTVFFGDLPAITPPSDPSIGYPPAFQAAPFANAFAQGPWEQFAFTVINGTFDGTRVQLDIESGEIWNEWCELQTQVTAIVDPSCTPLCVDGGIFEGYSCLPKPSDALSISTSATRCWWKTSTTDVTIDCGKYLLCSGGSDGLGVCQCTATHCSHPPLPGDTHFDLQVQGGSASGTVVWPNGPSQNPVGVFLSRQ